MSKQSESDVDVVVVGAGLAGLTAAAHLDRAGYRVVVRERRGDAGGNAATDRRDGFSLNRGPHALYLGGPGAAVLSDLGIAPSGGRPPTKGRIVAGGRTHIAPAGARTLLTTSALTVRERARLGKVLATLGRVEPSTLASTTVDEWLDDVAPTTAVRDLLAGLARLTTYANQPDELAAEVAVGQIQLGLTTGVLYLHGGWGSLVDQLLAVGGFAVETGAAVTELPDARAVVVAAGGPAATGRLLGRRYDVGPPAEVSSLDLGLAAPPEHDLVIGADVPFYFSNHSAVAELAPRGRYLASIVQYLRTGEDPDRDALDTFHRYAGVADESIVLRRRLHRMAAVSSIATAARGGLAGRPAVTDTGHPNVAIAGDWVGPVGHLADASLASGAAAAAAIVAHLERPDSRTTKRRTTVGSTR